MSLQRITCDQGADALQHVCDPCTRELGRVRGVLLIDPGFNLASLIEKLKSGTSEAVSQAQTAFETGVAEGKIHLISETTGSYTPEAQTGDGYGDEADRVLGYNHSLAFNDPSYAGNRDFWAAAEKSKFIVGWRTETLLHFSDKAARIQALDPVETDLNSAVVWQVTATWSSKEKDQLAPLDPLAKYFEGCWENPQGSSVGSN